MEEKAENENEDERSCDRISSLSDDILVYITSLLPGKRDLFTTALLARRWRYLWTLSPHINFDLSTNQRTPDLLLSRVLSRHSVHLTTCRIAHFSYSARKISWNPPENLETRWITHLNLKRITKLSLAYNPSFSPNPTDILTIPSLEELTLSDYNLKTWQPPAHSFPHLRSLCLKRTSLLEETLSALVGSAPLLERLALSSCDSFKHPRISSQILERLEIDHQRSPFTSLEIDAPALTSLVLHGWFVYIKITCPRLISLKTTCFHAEDDEEYQSDRIIGRCRRLEPMAKDDMEVLEQICGFEGSYIEAIKESVPSPFPDITKNSTCLERIQKLSINVNLNIDKHITILAFVLGRCPYLQELQIAHDVRLHICLGINIWSTIDTFLCLENQLKQLWIKGFTGQHLEQDFIKFILSSALMLKRLVISYHNKCSTDSLEALKLALPKARTYPNLNLIINKDDDGKGMVI